MGPLIRFITQHEAGRARPLMLLLEEGLGLSGEMGGIETEMQELKRLGFYDASSSDASIVTARH